MPTTEITFSHASCTLSGTLFLPATPPPHPAVIMVHGSGPVDRFGAEGTLRPVIAHFAASGYAVLAYDKPGVGASQGQWQRQTFEDRAAETNAAITLLARRPGIDPQRIGLWGISQGGWIAPLAAAGAPVPPAFLILVSATAGSPCAQYTHQLRQEMLRDGYDHDQIDRALRLTERRTQALAAGTPGAEMLAAEQGREAEEPWYVHCHTDAAELDYVRPLWQFDVLPVVRSLTTPLLAIWGADDIHMPVQRCARQFAEELAAAQHPHFALQVLAGAGHRLRRSGSDPAGQEFAPGYLDTMTSWLATAVG